jgi:hypothetical protein
MPIHREVKRGECISSIAFEHGFRWETIWHYPDNADLRALRDDPNCLLPGDFLVIPDRRERYETVVTAKRHRFRLRTTPVPLHVRLLLDGEPRRGLAYVLVVDGRRREGETDAEGWVKAMIPPDARSGSLHVEGADYELELRQLDPMHTVTGIQTRLRNLGLHGGPVDGVRDPLLDAAIRRFQAQEGLPETGEADEATLTALDRAHGSEG